MRQILHLIFALFCALFFSGCFATILNWSTLERSPVYKSADRDKVVAFGKIADSGDIVMIGQKFTYKLTPNSSHKIETLAEGNFTLLSWLLFG